MATILVVEDDFDTRDLLARLLEREGYDALSAANGWEALLVLDNHNVDLVLLDVMMPGMDGVTFLKILRNAQRKMSTPVIIVTAMSTEDLAMRTRGLDVQEVLPKTQKLFDELIESVHRVLKDRHPVQTEYDGGHS